MACADETPVCCACDPDRDQTPLTPGMRDESMRVH